MRSITTLDLQYAHRFYGFKGEAQYLHGHINIRGGGHGECRRQYGIPLQRDPENSVGGFKEL